jgi:type IV pilus assembly protein PilN
MIRINLLAVEQKPARARLSFDFTRQLAALGPMVLVLGFAGIGWWYWSLQQQAEAVQAEIAGAQAEVVQLRALLQQVETFEKRREQLRQRVELIESLRAEQSGPVHLLDELSRHLPERLWLTAMKQAGPEITVDGQTSSLTSLADFVSNLELSGYFASPVEIIDSQVESDKSGTDLVKFKVKAQFTMPGAGAPDKRQGE